MLHGPGHPGPRPDKRSTMRAGASRPFKRAGWPKSLHVGTRQPNHARPQQCIPNRSDLSGDLPPATSANGKTTQHAPGNWPRPRHDPARPEICATCNDNTRRAARQGWREVSAVHWTTASDGAARVSLRGLGCFESGVDALWPVDGGQWWMATSGWGLGSSGGCSSKRRCPRLKPGKWEAVAGRVSQ